MRGSGRLMAGAVVAVLFALPSSAAGDTFRPTRFDDPAPGQCKPHDCSLREAINAADDNPADDKVVLGEGTYEIQIPGEVGNLGPDNGDLNVGSSVTITGKGPKKTKIDANGLDRVFLISSIDAKPVVIKGLTMKGGDAGAVPDVQHPSLGGGIYAYASKVTLDHVALRDNEAVYGGAIRAQTTRLKITDSTIAGNNASEGGAIQATVALFQVPVTVIRSSTISGNFASKGGGILADGAGATASLKLPTVYLTNSTVAGNQASAEAGGIMSDNQATVTLDNSTVAYNMADDDNTGGSYGGGIHQHSGATFNVGDSIVASNSVGTGSTDPACSGTFAGSGNVLTAAAGCGSLPAGPNQFVGSALIGPLALNGGPTKTIEALATSPALGFAETCPKKDQRGVKRPHDDCDSGSYERTGP